MNNPNKKNQHRWSTTQCTELLEAIVDKIKGNPEEFEKPTASQFYSKLFELYSLPDTATLGVLLVKNKLRNMKTNFIKAKKWKAQIGTGLLEERKEQNLKDYINKICPNYDLLEEIFGQTKNISLPPINDSSKEMELESDFDNSFLVDIPNLQVIVEEMTRCRNELDELKLNHQIKSDQEKLYFEEMKWNMECEFKTKSLDIERQKVNLQKLKIEGELALKKLEIEKDFELKKFEMELKYRK